MPINETLRRCDVKSVNQAAGFLTFVAFIVYSSTVSLECQAVGSGLGKGCGVVLLPVRKDKILYGLR